MDKTRVQKESTDGENNNVTYPVAKITPDPKNLP
jgi:hypothetical protein